MHRPHNLPRTPVLICLLLVLAFSGLTSAAAQPRIACDETTFNFGSIYQEESVTHEFIIRNLGDAPLEIKKVTSSCGCTAALASDRLLKPGGQGAIQVTFNSGRMRDRVTKHIYVESNDSAQPRLILTITGAVKVEVDLVPSGLYVGNLQVGQSAERDIFIRPAEVKRFRILQAKADHPGVTVSKPVPAGDKLGGYRVTIRVGPLDTAQRISTYVILQTDLPHAKVLRIAVYGRVSQPAPPPPDSPSG
jgi:hypothetical protein